MEFKDAGAAFFSKLKGNTPTNESKSSGDILANASENRGDIGVNANHAAFRMFKSLSEDKKEEKVIKSKSSDVTKNLVSEVKLVEREIFVCVKCKKSIRMPETNNDVCCRCGSVYPYKAAKALYESQNKLENS